jgi:glycosyltransferase involved in cell wall biosynthesis
MRSGNCPASVLHLIDTGGPGGAETVFSEIARRIDGKPLRSVVVVPREGWLTSRLRTLGLEPVIIPASGTLNFRYLFSLLRLARAENVRLIHAHLPGSTIYATVLGLLLGIPVIGVVHGPTDVVNIGRFRAVKRWLLGRRHFHPVAVSEGTLESMADFGIDRNRIALIPNGIEPASRPGGASSALRREMGLDEGDLLVGAVGNIRAPKAYDVLLKAAARVMQDFRNVHFCVVGEGPQSALQPLLELRDHLGIGENFHFLGFRQGSPELLLEFDLFVSSSRSEGLPLSMLEAMLAGVCVVATMSGGAQEVIRNEESGLLVPVNDPEALAAVIARVLGDKPLRGRLAAGGRNRVLTDFSLDSTIARYQDLYDRCLGHRNPRSPPPHP